jgi:hypothetical protein
MPSRILAVVAVLFLGLAPGCMTPPKNDADSLPTTATGGAGNSPGFTSAEDEQWTKMGREMRGDGPSPQQQSFDPLRDLMESPRAQSIERSLGVDN